MNLLITICARGGSKGCKGKNTRLLFDKPLIDYTLKCADLFRNEFKNNITTHIAVNSDSDDILNHADYFDNVMKVKRPDNLALDASPKVPVIQQTTIEAEQKNNIVYDYVIDLDVTSPLRHTKDMYSMLKKCASIEYDYDLVFSAVPSRRNPYFNMVELRDGYAFKIKDSTFASRQEAPIVFDMNASIYCYKRNSLINKLKRITFEGKSGTYEMPERYVIDIDSEEDFNILELLIDKYYRPLYPHLFS